MVSPKVWQRSRVQRSAHQLHWQQGAAAATAPARTHTPHTPAAPFLQNKLFGGLGLVGSAPCTVQLELRGGQQTVSLKNRRDETESMPLFSSKDTVSGEVRGVVGCLAVDACFSQQMGSGVNEIRAGTRRALRPTAAAVGAAS